MVITSFRRLNILIWKNNRSLFMCFVFLDTLDAFAERLVRVFGILVDLDVKRPKPRLWVPSGFGRIRRRLMSEIRDDSITSPLSVGTSRDPTTFHDAKKINPSIDTEDEDGEYEQEEEVKENPSKLHFMSKSLHSIDSAPQDKILMRYRRGLH